MIRKLKRRAKRNLWKQKRRHATQAKVVRESVIRTAFPR